jgi:hypothetical protein
MLTRNLQNRRRGAVIVYAALTITLLIGLAALAIDIGFKHDRLRHVQAATDAAAMAGATDIFKNWKRNGYDWANSAKQAARAIATANGYTDGVDGCSVTVNAPPNSGPNVGKKYYVEVNITHSGAAYFSRVFSQQVLKTSARAVARASYVQISDGIIVLDLEDKNTFNAHGNGVINIIGAPVTVNSNHPEAAITNGSTDAQILATGFDITGGYIETGGSTFRAADGSLPPPMNLGTPPKPDPLAYLPIPNAATMPAGTITVVNDGMGYKTYTLTPGVYEGGLDYSGKANVIMEPGIYYMKEGGFSFAGQGYLKGAGVMIYNDTSANSNSQDISITGQGSVELSAPSSGVYQGILLFQERTSATEITVSGSGLYKVSGVFYAANARVNVTGNGDMYVGSQYISRYLDLGGNGNLNIDYRANKPPSHRVLQLVE